MTPEQIRAFQKWIAAVNGALDDLRDHVLFADSKAVKNAIAAGDVLAAAISKVDSVLPVPDIRAAQQPQSASNP